MIGQMPTQQVIAMLKAARPAQAFSVMASMPADRSTHVASHMEVADLAAILAGLAPPQQAELLAMVPPGRHSALFARLSMRQRADLLPAVPTDVGVHMVNGLSSRSAAELLSDVSPEVAARLVPGLPEAAGILQAMYELQAKESVIRAAHGVSWLDHGVRDLAADVCGRRIHVAIRFQDAASFGELDVDRVSHEADWARVAGLLMITNRRPDEPSIQSARLHERAGRRIELIHWIDRRDDGALKRALARLAG